MKVNTTMPKGLKLHYQQELDNYHDKLVKGHLQKAWRHLERAHILGQPYPYQHSEVHWLMLGFGSKINDWKEIRGQILRLFVGGVKSFVGKVPVGNTGGANVPPLRPMEIPDDLQQIIKQQQNMKAYAIESKISCKLTTPELRQRKASVIAMLKKLMVEKQEISNGFRYKFDGSDQTLDLLNDFIKTERLCCDFFTFRLTVADQESPVWLELSGPEGAKAFIENEIEF